MSGRSRLEGRVAVITGAGSGIGRATALLFAEEGAKIIASDINPNTAADTAREVEKAGGSAVSVKTDVSRESDVQEMIRLAVDTYGKLDILFNNAGIAGKVGFELSEEELDRELGVLFKGVFFGCKHAVPEMRKNGGGNIINTASIGGLRTFGSYTHTYNAAKAAVIHYTLSLSHPLGKENIRINCVCPGSTRTGLSNAFMYLPQDVDPELRKQREEALARKIPLRRHADPRETAYAVLFLASDESSFVTGASLVVDGGSLAM